MKYTEDQLWAMSTHVHCLTCGSETELDYLDLKFENEDDLDQAYDAVECCNDPALEAQIVSSKPLFDSDEANADAHIAANPRLGLYQDVYQYHPGEDLLNQLSEADDD